MNRKGFTLIDLLAVIILVALIGVLVIPSVIDTAKQTKQKAYDILIENIGTAAKTYFEECEYGDLNNEVKYGSYACTINDDNSIETTLGTLANLGFLPTKDTETKNGKTLKVVKDPRNQDNDMSDCQIKVIKETTENTDSHGIKIKKITYKLSKVSGGDNCPSEEDLEKVVIK